MILKMKTSNRDFRRTELPDFALLRSGRHLSHSDCEKYHFRVGFLNEAPGVIGLHINTELSPAFFAKRSGKLLLDFRGLEY
jgi:hypothetical protein